jgi:hypothetical protein
LTVAACDDDSGKADMMDASVGDMAMPDLAMPDLTPFPQGQAIVADVVGTAYVEQVPDAGETALPVTHILETQLQFPFKAGPSSDFSNFMASVSTLTISGCFANRYDATASPPKLPIIDANVGTVTIGGWQQDRFASGGPIGQQGFFAMPVPATGNCNLPDGGIGFYGCDYAGTNTAPPLTAAGSPTGVATAFPAIPLGVLSPTPSGWSALCASGLQGSVGTPACLAACDQQLGTGPANPCVQEMLYPRGVTDMGANSVFTDMGDVVSISSPGNGGMPYTASTQKITVPKPIVIVSITVGGTAITLGTPPSLADLTGHIDATKDIKIVYSCDPGQPTTAGAGCNGLGPFELITFAATTSQQPRIHMSTPSPQFGSIQCLEQAHRSDFTITVPAGAIAAALNGQTTGSMQLALVRVTAKLAAIAPSQQLFGAGVGQFAQINLP